MATTTKQGRLVSKGRTLSAKLVEVQSELQEFINRYNKSGGAGVTPAQYFTPYFMQEDGVTPRTDLELSFAQFTTGVTAMGQIEARIENNIAALIEME